jgi:pectin methylesterase-like acyl-CoA thioesterase
MNGKNVPRPGNRLMFGKVVTGILFIAGTLGLSARTPAAPSEEGKGMRAPGDRNFTVPEEKVFDFVVAKDSTGDFTTINEAVEAAPEEAERTTIFVKKGTYAEKVFIGDRWVTSNKVISLIGENVDSVIITWEDYHGKEITYPGKGTITADGMTAATMTVTSPDFYMENITVKNPSTAAQAEALYQSGDRQVLKNCKILGNQDTHRTKKGRRYFYFRSTIEGGVDFIYAGGTCYFYQCNIVSNRSGYITAPEDVVYQAALSSGKTLRYGFFFKDCDVMAKEGVSDGSVYLGRPWQPECGSVFLNCRLGSHINQGGWQPLSGNESSACFGEYKSMNAGGSIPVDISNRVPWSQQFTTGDVNDHMLLSEIYSSVSTTPFDPVPMLVAPAAPAFLEVDSNDQVWTAVDGATGYVVYANGSVTGFSKINAYTDTLSYGSQPVYTVRTVGALGNLSVENGETEDFTEAGINEAINSVIVGINEKIEHKPFAPRIENGILLFDRPSSCRVYSVLGQEIYFEQNSSGFPLEKLKPGIYIFRVSDGMDQVTFKIVK